MNEIKIWEHILKWDLAQNPTLNPNAAVWSNLQCNENHCFVFVRFFFVCLQRILAINLLLVVYISYRVCCSNNV